MKQNNGVKIPLEVAELAIRILQNVAQNNKTVTVWDWQTEYDRQQMMKYRSELLDAAAYLSRFCMPNKFRQEIERIFEKCHEDHWTLPVPVMQPPTKIITGTAPQDQPQTIDTIQKNLMEDVLVEDGYTLVILASHLQKADMLRYTNVGQKFCPFWKEETPTAG